MTDWVGLWFRIQAERGHSDEVPFFRLNLSRGEFTDLSFPHRERDGVAAMERALAEIGERPGRVSRPVPRPPWWRVPVLLWRGLSGSGPKTRPSWRMLNEEARAKPATFAFLVLNPVASRALSSRARGEKISVSAFLLERITAVVEEALCEGRVGGVWLLPVDMRGAFPAEERPGNCVSYVAAVSDGAAAEIDRALKTALARFDHWANWWIYQVGRVVGYRGMQRISRRAAARSFWIGSFTDLGDCTPVNGPGIWADCVWAIAAPGTPNNPVGCASIEWAGRRTISLRVHSAVSAEPERVARDALGKLAGILARELGCAAGDIALAETARR